MAWYETNVRAPSGVGQMPDTAPGAVLGMGISNAIGSFLDRTAKMEETKRALERQAVADNRAQQLFDLKMQEVANAKTAEANQRAANAMMLDPNVALGTYVSPEAAAQMAKAYDKGQTDYTKILSKPEERARAFADMGQKQGVDLPSLMAKAAATPGTPEYDAAQAEKIAMFELQEKIKDKYSNKGVSTPSAAVQEMQMMTQMFGDKEATKMYKEMKEAEIEALRNKGVKTTKFKDPSTMLAEQEKPYTILGERVGSWDKDAVLELMSNPVYSGVSSEEKNRILSDILMSPASQEKRGWFEWDNVEEEEGIYKPLKTALAAAQSQAETRAEKNK